MQIVISYPKLFHGNPCANNGFVVISLVIFLLSLGNCVPSFCQKKPLQDIRLQFHQIRSTCDPYRVVHCWYVPRTIRYLTSPRDIHPNPLVAPWCEIHPKIFCRKWECHWDLFGKTTSFGPYVHCTLVQQTTPVFKNHQRSNVK